MQTWTNSKGETVTVGAAVQGCLDRNGREIADTARVVVLASRNGVREMAETISADVPAAARAAGVVARVGAVALTADRLATLRAEIAAAEQSPAVVAYRQRVADAEAARARYEATAARIAMD